jgi:NAD-dependent dihydropyrimidine dehydrogenase PreA subunit
VASIPAGVDLRKNRTIGVHPLTMETSVPGVFAGGDIVSGPSTVISAIAGGRRAAVSIERYLKGEDMARGRSLVPDRVKKCPGERIAKMARQDTRLVPVSERKASFREVKLGFDDDTTRLESQRCMTCGSKASINYVDDCQLCLYCERDCPQRAITVSPAKKVDPILAWG